jgi:ABC-type sugar transport system permease subunit
VIISKSKRSSSVQISPSKKLHRNRSALRIEWIYQAWPLIPATLYLLGFLIIVIVYLAGLSLSDPDAGLKFPSFQPLISVLCEKDFQSALVNTILFTLIGTPLELLAGLALAVMIYRSFFMRGIIRSLFLIPLAIPALVTAMLLFILFDYPGGHINQLLLGNYSIFPAVISEPVNWRGSGYISIGLSMLGKIWRDMPISMLIILAGLNNIDPELFDAARTMGANLRQRLLHIALPLIIPSISTVLLLRSVEMWKEFIFPYVLAGRNRLLGTLIDFYYNDLGNSHKASVTALVMVLCIVVTTIIIMKSMDLFRKALIRR